MDENITMTTNQTLNGTAVPLSLFEIFQIAAPSALLIDRVITPIWYVIGMIGNPISTKIWLSRKMRRTNTSAIYLGSISIVHFLFIILHICLELMFAWEISTYNKPVLCEIFMTLYIIPQYAAPVLILGFTVERYIAVCHPFFKEQYCTVQTATLTVLSLIAFSVILGFPQAYIWTYDPLSNQCNIREVANQFYVIWTWVSEMLVFAIVPLTALAFNILVIREIRSITAREPKIAANNTSSSGNQTSTITLLSVSFYLICTLLPATIVYSIQSLVPHGDMSIPPQEWQNDPVWDSYLTYYVIRKLVEELCFSNYCCYVFIYCLTSSYFRNECKRLMTCIFQKLWTKNTSSSSNSTCTYAIVNSHGQTKIDRKVPQL